MSSGREPRPELSSFVGDGELPALASLVERAQVLTLIGPAGVGKSRLAARVVANHLSEHGRRALLIDFDSAEAAGGHSTAQVVRYVRRFAKEPLTIVLDNCDRALPTCRALIAELLQAGPTARILATCRERLGTAAESIWHVQPLRVPSDSADAATIAASPAVELFVVRAREVDPGFTLSASNAADVARICRAVDGLPLAIELAAARTWALSVASIREHLDEVIGVCTAASQGGRESGMGAAIEWTLAQLSEDERTFWCALSVFEGGWDVASARAVCAEASGTGRAVGLLTRLLSCSMVHAVPVAHGGKVRYSMLGVYRRYAAFQLERSGRSEAIRRRHAEWCLQLAESIPFGSGAVDTLAPLQLEQRNLRAALGWAVRQSDAELAFRLATVLHGLWYIKGEFTESRAWFDKVLALPGGSAAGRAIVTNWASVHALAQADFAAALTLSDAMRAVADELGDPVLGALGLDGLANILLERGNIQRAEAVFTQELELCGDSGLGWLRCLVLLRLAQIRLGHADVDSAHELAETALTELGVHSNVWTRVRVLNVLGCIALERTEFSAARESLSAALDLARRLEDRRATIEGLMGLARLELALGNAAEGRTLLGEALDAAEETDEALLFVRVLEAVVVVRAATRPEAVLHLAGAVSSLRLHQETRRLPLEDRRYAAAVEMAERLVRPIAGERAQRAGKTLSRGAAASLARNLLYAVEPTGAQYTLDVSATLTARELQIAQLLTRGLTNRAIGAELFISEGTVRAHVEHILSKLQLRSRVEVGGRLVSATAAPV